MRSTTETLISALRVLANDIESDEGVVEAALSEAANRLEEMSRHSIKCFNCKVVVPELEATIQLLKDELNLRK
jgi:hypothetical protein